MILNLLWINLTVVLIFLSGFIDSVDGWISKTYKFHHLPKPFSCALCTTFWASLIWVIATGQLSLLGVVLCLVNATLTSVTTPLITTIQNFMLKIIEILNRLIDGI